MTRKYELKQRAEQVEDTRRRIVEATSRLHLERGPAATSIAEVARLAGVQRRTVYNHFPDDAALFAACSAHWATQHPAPDPDAWTDLRQGLRELYAWYRETESMTANVLRDAEVIPSLRRVIEPGFGAYLEGVRSALARGLGRNRRVEAAVRLVTDFHSWRALAPLDDDEAVELAAQLVELAARRSRPRGIRARPARS
ncbi:MAG TPA: helix-turn-helix domain-containing protein [Gaiellaceae bacterium]|nr:helix-turn-helix domain-containing protein [Gaiellaceae bacterium]